MRKKRMVIVALGGNVLIRENEKGTAAEQWRHAEEICRQVFPLIERDYNMVLTHGNGPQVGNLLIKNERAADIVPEMPLDICGADSQGEMGYMIQQALLNELRSHNLRRFVVTMITQVLVDKGDPAFQKPTKPVGPFFSRERAEQLMRSQEWKMIEDSGRGWRRVVPSPEPKRIIQKDMIRLLAEAGHIVVACGGGGIPIMKGADDRYIGVEAVIDKDRASSLLAANIAADMLIILTRVPKVALNFGKPDQKDLDRVTLSEAKRYLDEGHFAPGSMRPKIEAAIDFLASPTESLFNGREVIITDPEHLAEALDGKHGTHFIKEA
jgi:carbamate kinase